MPVDRRGGHFARRQQLPHVCERANPDDPVGHRIVARQERPLGLARCERVVTTLVCECGARVDHGRRDRGRDRHHARGPRLHVCFHVGQRDECGHPGWCHVGPGYVRCSTHHDRARLAICALIDGTGRRHVHAA